MSGFSEWSSETVLQRFLNKSSGLVKAPRFRDAVLYWIDRRVSINNQNNEGKTALHLAVENDLVDDEYVDLLLQAGHDPKIRDNGGLTAMDYIKSMPEIRKNKLKAVFSKHGL